MKWIILFTKANWIKQNSVDPKSIQLLLQRFNISGDTIKKMVPVVNSQIQNGRMAASGQPYFLDYLDKSFEQIPFYDPDRHTWDANRFFDKRDLRFNYQFIKEYQKIWYFNNKPQHSNQVSSFIEAVNKSKDGTYMYCERNKYIPFRINHNVISFNRCDAMECRNLKPQLNQNRTVNTDSYNKLVKREYEQLWKYRQSAFIDPNSDTYVNF